MSKILDASCNPAGIVTAEGSPVPDAVVLSEGKKQSTGLLIMEGAKARYLPSSATDIKDLITSLVALNNNVIAVLTALDAVSTSPGSAAALITAVNAANVQLNLTKETLK